MKNIRSYTDFINERFTENFPTRQFDTWTVPEKPYKRKLTEEEEKFMRNNFSNFAFTINVDKNGYILLGAGEGDYDECMHYITEEDLAKYMGKVEQPANEDLLNEKVYVGCINNKPGEKSVKSWAQDAIFKKYKDEEEAKEAVKKLKEEGKSAQIFSKKEYKKIEKIREQGQ